MLYITLLLRIITYLTYIQYVWEIDDFVIIYKSDIFRGFFNYKNILHEIIVLP
jgi:hypothetical protein